MTYTAAHGLKAPTNESSTRPAGIDPGELGTQESTDPTDDPVIEATMNANLMSAFEYAKFADFDEEATRAAMDMFIEDEATSTPQFKELYSKLRESTEAADLSTEASSGAKLEEKPSATKEAAIPDSVLRRMIALKRRDFGEELTAEDQSELKKMDEEQKNAAPVSEGELRLPSRGSQS